MQNCGKKRSTVCSIPPLTVGTQIPEKIGKCTKKPEFCIVAPKVGTPSMELACRTQTKNIAVPKEFRKKGQCWWYGSSGVNLGLATVAEIRDRERWFLQKLQELLHLETCLEMHLILCKRTSAKATHLTHCDLGVRNPTQKHPNGPLVSTVDGR